MPSGRDVCDFADEVLGTPLTPWQRWVLTRLLDMETPAGGGILAQHRAVRGVSA